MFASLHSAFSSAGSKYGANGPSSKQSYTTTATLPARFSVHVAPQKASGFAASPYYPQSANVVNKSDRDGAVGYRPSIPQAQYPGPPRYDDRYAHAHPAPPRLNTSAPAAIPRGYADPKLSAPAPAPVSIPAPPRNGVPNFNIYQGSAQDTYIYEQSQGSKSDLLSTSEFDSVVSPSPTESMSSTVTMRGGADTPRTDAGSLEPSPVEPPTPMSRRNSLVFNGGPPPPMAMGMHGSYTGRSAGPAPPPVGRMGAFPPHMAAAMNRTPSMDSVDVRERIAIANAEYNSASTGSYYSSPEPSTKSHTPSPPQHASHPIPPMTPGSSSSQRLPQQQQPQAVYSEPAYIHTSPEAAHAHIQGPSGTRSRSISPPQPQPLQQQQQQGAYPDTRPSSRHEIRRPSPPQQQSSGYGSGASTPQMRRSPSQRGDYSLPPSSNSPPTYPQADDYFTQNAASSSRHAPQQQQAYGPDAGYANNMKYSTTPSSSPPREDPYAQDRRDRSSSTSPPESSRQTSTRYSSGAGHQERDRYSHSPPDTSVRLDDDGYSRERDAPRRERKVSYSSSMGRPIPDAPVSYASSSGSSSSNSTARGERDRDRDRERDYAPRDRDPRDRDRERERDRDRDYYSSSSSRDRDRDRDSRRNSVYPAEALQQQQSTVPFHKSTPPSPPNQNQSLKYPAPPSAPLPPLPNGPQRQGSYPPPAAPERMTRQRSVSMSSAPHAPSRLSTVEDVSMSMSNMSLGPEETSFNGGRGPRHLDLGTPSSNTAPMPSTSLEADPVGAPVYRRRRMSVISQVSDAGSMATTATGVSNAATIASSALPPPPSASMPPREYAPESRSHRSASDPPAPIPAAIPPSQQQQAYRPEQQPAPYRRMSDGDRPASRYDLKVNTEYAVEYGKQYTPHPEPVRRYSDGETSATLPSVGFRSQGQQQQQYQQQYGQYQQGGLMGGRNVRWNDNLICPSPVLPSAKRQGWYNRRGDQLWTNDGMFRPAPADQQYPPDLDDYPDHGEGWQNEDGVRIDMEHRRIPKVPRRSALKVPGGVSSSAGGGVSFA